ncbi:MAG: AMP-binding protein [Polyangiaceae bacterium]
MSVVAVDAAGDAAIAKHSGAGPRVRRAHRAHGAQGAGGRARDRAVARVRRRRQVGGLSTWEELLAAGASFEEASGDAAVVMYTSGTTGKPKGAVRKFQREAVAHVLSFIEQTPMVAGERHLVTCPLYHATAFAFTSFTYILGGSVVVMGDFKPETFLEGGGAPRITTTAMVPTMLHRVLGSGRIGSAHDSRRSRSSSAAARPSRRRSRACRRTRQETSCGTSTARPRRAWSRSRGRRICGARRTPSGASCRGRRYAARR